MFDILPRWLLGLVLFHLLLQRFNLHNITQLIQNVQVQVLLGTTCNYRCMYVVVTLASCDSIC